MGFANILDSLPGFVKVLIVILVLLHLAAFVVYVVLLSKSTDKSNMFKETIAKIEKSGQKLAKGSKLD